MSDLQLIESALQRAAARRRWERALRGLWRGLLVGALLWLVVLGAYKLFPIPYWSLTAAGAAGVVCVLVGMIIGGWRKIPLSETARWVDGREHLQERLSTALEFGKTQNDGTWRDLVVTDAMQHVKELDPRRLVKFSLSKAGRWAFLVLLLAAGLGFVPEYRSKTFVQKQADQKNIKEAGKQLVELTKQNLQKRSPALETTQKSMQSVSELGDQLTKQNLTRSDALKDLANVTDKLKEQVNDLGKDPAIKRMEQAARSPNGGNTSMEAARLQKQIEDTKKELGEHPASPEAMDNLQKQLEKLQEAAKAAADKPGGMSASDKQKISQSMTALSKQAQEMGMQMPNLDQAIEALAANQTDMFLKDLQAQSNDLEKTRDMAKSLQQMQQQTEKLGKDLAEQLKNGQADAALNTLKKMEDQLKSGKMSSEQMQKMMDEVAKACEAGGKYGKVGDMLKSATAQLKQGQKSDAAQSLNGAAKELERLMQQMGDAQSLEAELDALNRATQSIGTSQSWGQCKGSGSPGGNPGGKPGHGVGTWADEDSGWAFNGQQSDRWDNSGIVRPDTAPKGQSDRGDGEMNDALKPTKVKGQFSPGGQMPSITLKGVSIKGESKVQYEESAATAQSDAQSALSQEKVPRAYQNSVRDYFDDLKK